MEPKLQKPVFVKLNSLENSRDGYNVYVKVLSVENLPSANQNFDMVRAVVADETGSASAFFKGDNAKLIKKDAVIAIRNGKIRLVKGHISLEVDIFGRITQEKVEINPNSAVNISEKQINRRPRAQNRDTRPRKQGETRKEDREANETRRPRNEEGERPRRQEGERRPRREEGERRPRNEESERPRREEGERRPRRQDGDRRPRNEEGTERRRQGPRGQGNFNNKPKIEWTKVGAIEPGEENINLMVKVLSAESVKNRVRVVLGDETGKVKGFFYENEALKEGNTIVIFRAEASVVKEHIQIQLPSRGGKIEESRTRKINEVDETVDISAKAWVESA